MRVFCFHSVRPILAIPPATAWPSEALHDEFKNHLTVEPDWFYSWLPKAKEFWGDDLVVTFDDAFRDVMVPAILSAAKYKIRTIVFVPTAHMASVFPYAPYDVMDGSEIGYLAGQGVEIGSHSHRHQDHRRLHAESMQAYCLMSQAVLRDTTGKRPRAIAPPHAHFTKEFVDIALDSGYEEVFGTFLHPAGRLEHTYVRHEADMNGWRTFEEDSGYGETPTYSGSPIVERLWPWEM